MHCRFAPITCSKVGGMIISSELYLCEKELGLHKPYKDFLYAKGPVVNYALLDIIREKIQLAPIAGYVDKANSWFSDHQKYNIPMFDADYNGLRQKTGGQFEVSDAVRERGNLWLESLGIERNKPLLLFSNRDPVHLNQLFPEIDFSYHSYRDTHISNMIPMVKIMVKNGYAAIRMGAHVSEPLDEQNPMIIDYPNSGRTDERDAFLGERCRLSISVPSGIRVISEMFRRPGGIVNASPLTTELRLGERQLLHAPQLWIPKHYWLVSEKRFMPAREIISLGADQFFHTHRYISAEIELVENTPEEITEFAIELEQQINNVRKLTDEDIQLYKKFWQIVLPNTSIQGRAEIGISFLRRNTYFLD